ncbi:hypothetical protein QOT17_012112 [Balamuthia mandrillaris]
MVEVGRVVPSRRLWRTAIILLFLLLLVVCPSVEGKRRKKRVSTTGNHTHHRKKVSSAPSTFTPASAYSPSPNAPTEIVTDHGDHVIFMSTSPKSIAEIDSFLSTAELEFGKDRLDEASALAEKVLRDLSFMWGQKDNFLFAHRKLEATKMLARVTFKKNQFKQAAVFFQEALEIMLVPNSLHSQHDVFVVYKMLGESHRRAGNLEEALAAFLEADALNVPDAPLLHALCKTLRGLDRPVEALRYCERIVEEVDPSHSSAYATLGLIYRQLGYINEALESLKKAIILDPSEPTRFYNYGNALSAIDKPHEALMQYEKAEELGFPSSVGLYINKGTCLMAVNADKARETFELVLASDPNNVLAHFNLASLFSTMKRVEEAIHYYKRLLEIFTTRIMDLIKAVVSVEDLYRYVENRNDIYEEVAPPSNPTTVASTPLNSEISSNNQQHQAIARQESTAFKRFKVKAALYTFFSIPLAPTSGRTTLVLNMTGIKDSPSAAARNILFDLSKLQLFAPSSATTSSLPMSGPTNAIFPFVTEKDMKDILLNTLTSFAYGSLSLCDWEQVDHYLPLLMKLIDKELPSLMHSAVDNNDNVKNRDDGKKPEVGGDSKGSRGLAVNPSKLLVHCCDKDISLTPIKLLRIYAAYSHMIVGDIAPIVATSDNTLPFSHSPRNFAGHSRIRLGYVAPPFTRAGGGHALLDLFALHDRELFDVHCFVIARDIDPWHDKFAKDCEHFIHLPDVNYVNLSQNIASHGIHILVDLIGISNENRIRSLALRPAPLQVAYMGHPHTTGTPFVDYLIADQRVIPDRYQSYYSEKIIYLPDTYSFNSLKNHWSHLPSSITLNRHQYGLPDRAFVFANFNDPVVLSKDLWQSWMQILNSVPKGVLWLMTKKKTVINNLRAEAEMHGVDRSRIYFVPDLETEQYLEAIAHADLCLDTWKQNGHNTASDFLWMGVPVLTLANKTMATRTTMSILHALPATEFIAADSLKYEFMAVSLAREPLLLAHKRAYLLQHRGKSPLFDSEARVRHLEQGYQAIWRRYHQNLPPEHIILEEDDEGGPKIPVTDSKSESPPDAGEEEGKGDDLPSSHVPAVDSGSLDHHDEF